jgi:hypothetical protein
MGETGQLGGGIGKWQIMTVRALSAPGVRVSIMKTHLLGGLAALALVAGIAPAAAQTVEFTVINNSSFDLHYFYTTPSNENHWGDDLLGETGILEAGYQATATIGDGSDQCLYDFKFVMDNGAELIEPQIDICQLDSYTIND